MPFKKYMRRNSVSEVITDFNSSDQVDRPPSSFHVTNWDIFGLLYSITIHIVDVAFDVNLAYHYFKDVQYTYFSLTICFMLIPAVIITIISIRMYVVDNDTTAVSRMAVQRRFLCFLVLLLQLAPVLRYCDSLNYALRSRRAEKQHDKKRQETYYRKMLNEDSDVALLRVFECYLESAPQQVLQVSLLLMDYSKGTTFHLLQQSGSIVSSFLSMAWCMASYHRSIRFDQDNKNNISWTGTVFQFLWHLNVTVSRILALAVVASLFPLWTALGVLVHWVTVSVWLVVIDRTSFLNKSLLDTLFPAMLGLVYIFNYISSKEGPTRRHYLVYYSLCFMENIAAVVAWALLTKKKQKQSWYYYPLIIGPVVAYLVGMVSLVVYYRFFHPKKFEASSKANGQDNAGLKLHANNQGDGERSEVPHKHVAIVGLVHSAEDQVADS